MSEVDSSLVYTGFWINYSKGKILGATLTINEQSVNFIVALAAIMVAAASDSLWNIILFAAHQCRATSESRDGLFRQQQVLFRSLMSPGATVLEFIKLLAAWNGKVDNPIPRCLVPATIALAFATGSLIAGILSSNIANTTAPEVLVNGHLCQDLNYTAWYTNENMHGDIHTKTKGAALSYAQECYSAGPLPSQCNFFVNPRVSFQVTSIPCPFKGSICLENSTESGINMDSGYVDSDAVFGLNAAPGERVQFRRQASCAPLKVREHTTVIDAADDQVIRQTLGREPWPSESYLVFSYGTSPLWVWDVKLPNNGTTRWSTLESNTTFDFYTTSAVAYTAPRMASQTTFYPLDSLQHNDADITAVFIFPNRVESFATIDDPVYSFHREVSVANTTRPQDNQTRYEADFPAGVIGCTEQYEYCIRDTKGALECTAPSGAVLDGFDRLLPSANVAQLATLEQLALTIVWTNLKDAAGQRPAFLNASNPDGYELDGLPNNQWMLDMQKMEGFVWAGYQTFNVMHATGYPATPDMLTSPSSKPGRRLCRSQKVVKPGGFANVNVFGFAFICSVCSFLILLDHGVLRNLVVLYRTITKLPPTIQYWKEDGLFQLQRLAYEQRADDVSWHGTGRSVPTTNGGDLLKNPTSYATNKSNNVEFGDLKPSDSFG